jgi:hypothetical protein
MKSNLKKPVFTSLCSLVGVLGFALIATSNDELNLVASGKPACTLVAIGENDAQPLLQRAAGIVRDTVRQWTGVQLPLEKLNEPESKLPAKQAIVFTTVDSLKKSNPGLMKSHDDFAKARSLDDHGFAIVPLEVDQAKQLFIVGKTARGVYNGAIYLRDFCIDGKQDGLYAEYRSVSRSPRLGGRVAYALSIWGNAAQYTPEDWATEFQSFARDGIDRIYFWVSGHFPSKKFPQTYKVQDIQNGKLYDTTADSRIATIPDLQRIIKSAHELDLKIYLGGGLGGWVGTQFITNQEPETMKQGNKEPTLCPSNRKSHQSLVEYYQELYAALPQADGLFIESADESGDCHCASCSRQLDNLGSRQFGQSQLAICQEIMSGIWRDHPHARFAYTIGYQEHKKDVAYYKLIKQLSTDPRFEWMEARNSWSFPGADGEALPAAKFSPHVMHWRQYYNAPLDALIADASRANKEGLYGLITSFEPGYATGSFYNDIPFPVDLLPYALTGFVFREATWNPELTTAEMRARIQQRFFGKEAPAVLGEDLWKLREIIRTHKNVNQVAEIEKHIQAARANETPKTREGLALMTRAIADIQMYLTKKKDGSQLTESR